MNYNFIFKTKLQNIVFSRKHKLLSSVFYHFYNNHVYYYKNFNSIKEINREIKQILNILDNFAWEEKIITISRDNLYFHPEKPLKSFSDEIASFIKIQSPLHTDFNVDKILALTPQIIICIKDNMIHICDGYHRVMTALTRENTITFKCAVGTYKNCEKA